MGMGQGGISGVDGGWVGLVGLGAKPHMSDLTGTSWRLVEFKGSDNTVLKPKDRNKYTVVFGDGGRLSAVVDCNQGHGTWDSDGAGACDVWGAGVDADDVSGGGGETGWESGDAVGECDFVCAEGRALVSFAEDGCRDL